MKKLRILFLCCGLILSSFGFAESKDEREIKILPATPTFQNEIPNIFRPIGNFFRKLFGKKRTYTREYPNPNVKSVSLIQNQTVIVHSTISSKEAKGCLNNNQSVEVLTKANEAELGNEVFIYRYKVTAGKIVGEGSQVVWDLLGVAPGTHRIIAEVDNGCSFCGQTVTTEICVVECPNCN